jgi:hypothetical protein
LQKEFFMRLSMRHFTNKAAPRLSVLSALIILWGLGGAAVAAAQAARETPQEIRGNDLAIPQLPGQIEGKTITTGLTMSGTISFIINGSTATVAVQHLDNTRTTGTSGALRLTLMATTSIPTLGQTIDGYTLATYDLAPLDHDSGYASLTSPDLPYTAPPAGCYYVTLVLQESQASGYVDQDLHTFAGGGTPDGSGYDLFSFGGADCSASAISCLRDSQTACLLNGRFQVRVTWRTRTASGSGNVMSFIDQRAENDESVFFWFFDSTNFEMGIKMLNACTFNNKFWIYIGGLTDQGWTVTVTDTKTGAARTYANAIGHLSTPVGDTSALPCP